MRAAQPRASKKSPNLRKELDWQPQQMDSIRRYSERMSRNSITLERRGEGSTASRALRKARLLLGILALLGSSSLSAEATYHVLQKGETLFSISRQYNVPVDAIVAANGIADPSKLKVGEKLLIPSLHKVQRGETLFGIARSHGISVESLRSANRLGEKSLLKVGDVLYIPGSADAKGGTAAPVAQASSGGSSTPAASGGGASASGGAAAGGAAAAAGSSASAGTEQAGKGSAPPASTKGPPPAFDPPAVKVSNRSVDMGLIWPCGGDASYLDGKLFGVMFRPRQGDPEKAVAAGTVVSAGPYRGFGQVVFVQGRGSLIYVYGGNESIVVRVGDKVRSGQELGRVGVDAKEGRPTPVAYFFVFKNGEALDPATAPRD